MIRARIVLLACVVPLLGCGWLKTRRERAEYEKAAAALKPTFDKIADIRDRTLIPRSKLEELEKQHAGIQAAAFAEEGERCQKAATELAAIEVDINYEDGLLKSYVWSIANDLKFAHVGLQCDDLSMLGVVKCTATCDQMFEKLERDAKAMREAAKSIYKLDIETLRPRK